MNGRASTPEVLAPPDVAHWVAERGRPVGALNALEHAVLAGTFGDDFLQSSSWRSFEDAARELWTYRQHVVIRGLPQAGGGVSAILAALALSTNFRAYRGGRVVKHFRMTPWTTALSHTLREGHFHTDLNVASNPPPVTAIQCGVPDPGAPHYGANRVAVLADLTAELERRQQHQTLSFLHEADVTMVSDTSPDAWCGRIVEHGRIRFHPETIRAAQRRHGDNSSDFEVHLDSIQDAAMAVSVPISLAEGDILLVSNTRALHYRGACTVDFIEFPRTFRSREIYVLHLMGEPAS